MVRDLGKLHSLACLELEWIDYLEGASLAPLSSLQQLTRIVLSCQRVGLQEAAVLAGLRQLQEVECSFEDPHVAAVALAGCSSFQGSIRRGAAASAPPRLKCNVTALPAFDIAAVGCLELVVLGVLDMVGMASICQALASCAELRALQDSRAGLASPTQVMMTNAALQGELHQNDAMERIFSMFLPPPNWVFFPNAP
jgi:hypothetical protein